jgi:hypothetical protein
VGVRPGAIWKPSSLPGAPAYRCPLCLLRHRGVNTYIIQGRPLWATVGFALGVFAGAIGCILLLLKRPSSFYLFCASLFGVVIAIAHSLAIGVTFGVGEIIGIVIMPVAIAVFLIWYAKYCQKKGWLKTHNE